MTTVDDGVSPAEFAIKFPRKEAGGAHQWNILDEGMERPETLAQGLLLKRVGNFL